MKKKQILEEENLDPKHKCHCQEGEECICGDNCDCEKECHCHEDGHCTCGDECHCGDDCTCGDDCKCHEKHDHEHCGCGHCHCDDDCDCEDCANEYETDGCECSELAGQYLSMAQRLQADFDNYRKRVAEQLDYQRNEGKKSVIEVFLPCLDTFRDAKKSITDEKVLEGVNMIENKILTALSKLGVEKIESIGQPFDHNLHEVLAVMRDESKENDIILEEYQAGYTFNGKVIRYAKVIVNKL